MSRSDTFGDHRALIAVCVGAAAVEAAVLAAVAPQARAVAPQVVAIPPLGLFHDLRWLFVYHSTWWGFAVGLAAVVLVRAALTAVLVRAAWPAGGPPPSWRSALTAGVTFNILAGLLLSPIVTLLFGIAVVPFSWPYLAAVPAMLFVALLLGHGGVVSPWWRMLPPWRALAWVLTSFFVLSAASLAATSLPRVLGVLVAALAGLFDAWAWYGVTSALARREAWPRWRLPVTPLTAAALLLVFTSLARLGFAVAAQPPQIGTAAPAPAGARQPVLVVAGFGSPCCLKAAPLQRDAPQMLVQQFSYRGLDVSGAPLPHGSAATDIPLPVMGDRVAAQVDRLHALTGLPVTIVAESEGTLATYAYLARHPDAPVGTVVLLSPIVDPGQVTYPIPGRQGRGLVAGWELRALLHVIGSLSPFGSSASDALLQSVSATGARYAAAAGCEPVARRLSIIPLADAVTLPTNAFAGSVLIVPAFHGGLLGNAAVRHRVLQFIAGRPVRPSRTWQALAQVITGAATAWRVPVLASAAPGCPPRPLVRAGP